MGRYLIIVLLFLFGSANAQTLLPTQVIKNGSFAIDDLWLIDPDSLGGNYPVATFTTVLNAPANSIIGIQVDTMKLRDEGDYVAIYDGPSVNSPILTKLSLDALGEYRGGDWGIRSTGSVVTIVFRAAPPYDKTPIYGWRLRIKSLQPSANHADFLPIFQGGRKGNIQLADYDKDGDKDVLLGGEIYRNDSRDDSLYVFDLIQKPLGNWRSAKLEAADFDGDGFKDLFIIGNQVSPSSSVFKTAIYKNNNGSFSEAAVSFPYIGDASVAVLDYNKDGKMDIACTGFVNGVYIFKLYLNHGNFNFVETATNLPGLGGASMSWLDFDKDGDLDVVMNGYNTSRHPMRLFINNNNSFTDAQLIAFFTSGGEVSWADIDGDGHADIVNTGVNTPGNVDAVIPEILFNNGNGTFTRRATNLPAMASSQHDWADYDGDGDMDMLVSGGEYITTIKQYAAIFKNNGNANFSKVSLGDPVSISSVKWVDFNKDGKWDVFVAGRQFTPSALYKNVGSDSFQVSTYPFTTYRVKGSAVVEDFTNDGFVDVLFAGEIKEENCDDPVYSSTLVKSLGWRLFPTAKLTRVADLNADPGGNGSDWPYWRWGDVDSDGKLDVLLTHDPSGFGGGSKPLKIFKNNGNNKFTVMFNDWVGENSSSDQVGVIDIDNDGINELFIVPNNLYRWNGSGFTTLYEDKSFNRVGNTSVYSYYDFADYNKDGFTDVAISQYYSMYILRNNGQGRFVRTKEGQNGPNHKFLKWADLDSDGDPDLLTSKFVYENTSYGGFRFRDVNIINEDDGLVDWNGHTGVGDFNKDGYADMFTINYNSFIKPASLFYNQQGKLFFENKPPANFFKYNWDHQGAEAFDVDNDGDDDIICSSGNCLFSCIYLNNYNIRNSFISLRTQNSGGEYVIGTSYPISWTGNNLSNAVTIELSLDSGSTWSAIIADALTTAGGGNYSWQIKNVQPSRNCLVRLKDSNNSTIVDMSDKVFAIVPEILSGKATSPQSVCADTSFTVVFTTGNAPAGSGLQLWESVDGGTFAALETKPYEGMPLHFIVTNNSVSAIKKHFIRITYPLATGIGQSYNTDTSTTKVIKPVPPVIEVNNYNFVVTNTDPAANYTWEWLMNNDWDSVTPPVTTPFYQAIKTGSYRVQLLTEGCVEHSNAIAVRIDSATGNNSTIYLYPNPVTSILTLDSLSGDWSILDIVTADGAQKVASFNITNQLKVTVNIGSIRAGMYLAVLRNRSGKSISIKFIKI